LTAQASLPGGATRHTYSINSGKVVIIGLEIIPPQLHCRRPPVQDPISRLAFAKSEIDKHFGAGYADRHPETVNTIMVCATLDWCAQLIALALTEPEQNGLPGSVVRGASAPGAPPRDLPR
jgi:hypothetical protein